MKISFITDEVTQSFDEAVRFARQNGLAGLELRSVEDTAIDMLPAETRAHGAAGWTPRV